MLGRADQHLSEPAARPSPADDFLNPVEAPTFQLRHAGRLAESKCDLPFGVNAAGLPFPVQGDGYDRAAKAQSAGTQFRVVEERLAGPQRPALFRTQALRLADLIQPHHDRENRP